jgi:hypothetical protein
MATFHLRKGTKVEKAVFGAPFCGGMMVPLSEPFLVPEDGWYTVERHEDGTVTMRAAEPRDFSRSIDLNGLSFA